MQKIKELLKNLSVVVIALLVCFLLAEGATRIFWAAPGYRYPQTLHNPDSLLGWVMIPNQDSYTYDVPVHINSHGLRDDEFTVAKPDGVIRILNIGDSVTYGVAVPGDETYPNQLEKMLNTEFPADSFEVINAGVQRYYTYQELDYLRRDGVAFHPDIVIVGFYQNDFGVRPKVWKREYENSREQFMTALWHKIPFVMNIVKNSALLSLLRDRYFKLKHSMEAKGSPGSIDRIMMGISDEGTERLWSATAEYIQGFKALSDQYGFKLLIAAFPAANQVISDMPDSSYPARLISMCEESGIPVVDLLPVFKANYTGDIRSLFFRYDAHPNAHAHRIAAEAILQALRQFQLLPVKGDGQGVANR